VSSAGLRPKSDCSGKAQKQLYSNLQTSPLVREVATKLQTRNCLKEISRRKKNWSQVLDGRLTPGRTVRLSVGRKLTAAAVGTVTVCSLQLLVVHFTNIYSFMFLLIMFVSCGACGSVVVKALCYKPEDRGFDSR
jgi:hypothetical protein